MSVLDNLHGTVAALLLASLLFVDEAGVPLPFAPNEVLLLVGGLLIGTGAMPPWLFLPLALVAMASGSVAGYGWARAVGTDRLCALATRVGAGRTYDRAATRIRRASVRQILVARLLPGLRTYATLVAGATGVPLRTFAAGALPALVVWTAVLVAVGVAVGAPAEHLLSQVERLATTGVLLVAVGLGALLTARHVPAADPEWEQVIGSVPSRGRLGVAIALDVGIVATIVAGLDRITRSAIHRFHPDGVDDVLILGAAVVVAYVVATRRGPGMTAGERLLEVSYRRRRRHHRERAAPPGDARTPGDGARAGAVAAPRPPAHDAVATAPDGPPPPVRTEPTTISADPQIGTDRA